jgi:hypothetical protein
MKLNVTTTFSKADTSATILRAGVTIVAPVVTAQAVSPISETTYESLVSAVTCIIPAAEINYILLAVGARVDDSGLYRYITDSVSVSDQFTQLLNKGVSDSVSTSDTSTRSPGKGLADSVSTGDSFSRTVNYNRNFSDSAVADSSGSLRSQGYCDFTYFAEDYVGYSRTFT